MRYLKMLAIMVIVLVFGVVGMVFFSANADSVTLDLIIMPSFSTQVGVLVLSTLLLGFALGVLLSAVPLMTAKMARTHANQQLKQAKTELHELRMSPLKSTDVN